MNPIGFGFLDRPGVAEQVRLAQKAEALGYDSLWVTETRLARDAFSVLGAMAAIDAPHPPRHRHRQLLDPRPGPDGDEHSRPSRTSRRDGSGPGLGAYWDPLAWKQGIDRAKPVTQMREYVGVLRRLLALEEGVTFEGEFVKVRDLTLDLGHGDPRDPPRGRDLHRPHRPADDGAHRRDRGRSAHQRHPPSRLHEALARAHGGGGRRAGRSLDDIEKLQLVNISMDGDPEKARFDAKRLVTQYLGQQPHFAKALDYPADRLAELKAVMGGWPPRPGGVEDAMALVDDALVSDLIAHGTPEECVASAERWLREGLDQLVLIPLSRNYDEILEVFAP